MIDPHPSDQDLLESRDGELSPRRAAEVRAHLSLCPACQNRLEEIERAVDGFGELHEGTLPPVLISRARLKAQLADLAAAPRHRASQRPLAIYALAAALCVILGAAAIYQIVVSRTPDPGPAVPRTSLTPGATRPVTTAEVCATSSEDQVRMIPVGLKRQVFQEYGISNPRPDDYEVDYLITPELGGSNDIRNLWPQPYSSTLWNARVKDALEDRLHHLVCEGKVALATAQRDIANDWISAYKKYFHTDRPL